MTDDRARNSSEASIREISIRPAGEFGGHLVPPGRPARSAADPGHRVEAEGEEDRLLQPLIDPPRAVDFFGDTTCPFIQRLKRFIDGLAHGPRRVGIDVITLFEGFFDCGAESGNVHFEAFQ